MEAPLNLLADVPQGLPKELFQTVLQTAQIKIKRIISYGHVSPEGFWYDQETSECVVLLKGAARVGFEHESSLEMTAGSFVNIPAHKRHRVEWTDPNQPTVWLAIHYR